jgi:hypothetical protein
MMPWTKFEMFGLSMKTCAAAQEQPSWNDHLRHPLGAVCGTHVDVKGDSLMISGKINQ